MDKLSRMLTTKEAREILGLSRSNFYRLLKMKPFKLYQPVPRGSYRISEDDLREYIKKCEVK